MADKEMGPWIVPGVCRETGGLGVLGVTGGELGPGCWSEVCCVAGAFNV